MNPNAAEKSLNSNTRCRFPFTTLHPLSFFNSAAISFSESFVAAMMKTSRSSDELLAQFSRHYPPPDERRASASLDSKWAGLQPVVFAQAFKNFKPDGLKPVLLQEFPV